MTEWLAILALLAGTDPQATEQRPPSGRAAQAAGASSSSFIDFSRLELELRGGMLFFSEDFEADPEPAADLLLRVPFTWLTPRSDPKGEYFGLFVHFTFSGVDRDPGFEMEEPSGNIFFAGAGADYAFVSGGALRLSAQVGLQYEYFGDVTDLHDGFALTLGLSGALHLGKGFRIDLNPQIHLADAGDWIAGAFLGVSYEF